MLLASRTALIALLCSVLLSIVVSPWRSESATKAAPLILGLALYVATAQFASSKSLLGPIPAALILTSAGLSLAALLDPGLVPQIGNRQPLTGLGQILPDRFNANVVAGSLVLLWPFGIARGLTETPRRTWQRVGAVGALAASALSLGAVTLTGSYAGAISAACGAVVLGLAAWPHLERLARAGLRFLLALATLPLGWALISAGQPLDVAMRTLRERAEIWSRALMIVRAFPFTGIGFGNFEAFVQQLMPLLVSARQTVSHAHNLYLQVAVDLGLPGLATVLVLVATGLLSAIRVARSGRQISRRDSALLAGACLASLAGMCIHGLVDAAVWGNKGAFLPWIVMGFSTALAREPASMLDVERIGDHSHDH